MVIDCVQCMVRGAACAGCAVTFVTESGPAGTPAAAGRRGGQTATAPVARTARPGGTAVPPGRPRDPGDRQVPGNSVKAQVRTADSPVFELDADELRALAALADAGLIPPLRFVPPMAKAS